MMGAGPPPRSCRIRAAHRHARQACTPLLRHARTTHSNTKAPCIQNGLQAKSGFEMCLDIGPRHIGCWDQNTSHEQPHYCGFMIGHSLGRVESTIKKFTPHCICRHTHDPAALADYLGIPVPHPCPRSVPFPPPFSASWGTVTVVTHQVCSSIHISYGSAKAVCTGGVNGLGG